MTILVLFLKGLLVGFVIAAPVGPVGVLCVQRTLVFGTTAGLLSGLGAALGDAVYGCIAAFGLTLISQWLSAHAEMFRLGGGLFLLVLGSRMLLVRPRRQSGNASDESNLSFTHAFMSTALLTLTNPITIVAFLGIFSFVGIAELDGRSSLGAIALVLGVLLGSEVWWLALALGANRFGRRLNEGGMLWINRGSGLLMLAFGLYGTGEFLWSL